MYRAGVPGPSPAHRRRWRTLRTAARLARLYLIAAAAEYGVIDTKGLLTIEGGAGLDIALG